MPVWLASLWGCGDDPCDADPLPCALAEACRTEEGQVPDCVETVATATHCGAWPDDLSQEGLLFAGGMPVEALGNGTTFTITDAVTWQQLLDQWSAYSDREPEFPAIDWADEWVVVAQLTHTSTCGFGPVRHGLQLADDGLGPIPTLFVAWIDESGACDLQCDMGITSAVFYRAPRFPARLPKVCATVENRCP